MKSLEINHWPQGKAIFPILLSRNEPRSKQKIQLKWTGNSGEGWGFGAVSTLGKGRYLSLRHYSIEKPQIFYSEISEPVLCLSIALNEPSESGAIDMAKKIDLCREGRWNLLLIDTQVRSMKLSKGYHSYLDILLRNEEAVKFSRLTKYKGIQHALFSFPIVSRALFSGQCDIKAEKTILRLIDEIGKNTITVEDFAELTDGLMQQLFEHLPSSFNTK